MKHKQKKIISGSLLSLSLLTVVGCNTTGLQMNKDGNNQRLNVRSRQHQPPADRKANQELVLDSYYKVTNIACELAEDAADGIYGIKDFGKDQVPSAVDSTLRLYQITLLTYDAACNARTALDRANHGVAGDDDHMNTFTRAKDIYKQAQSIRLSKEESNEEEVMVSQNTIDRLDNKKLKELEDLLSNTKKARQYLRDIQKLGSKIDNDYKLFHNAIQFARAAVIAYGSSAQETVELIERKREGGVNSIARRARLI